jgi:aryl-alcohol dehydrogenase-like predicted oxidoreductase
MKAMKKLVQNGKVRCVGVSNFNLKRLKSAQEAFAPLELASNQVKYNLLDRRIEANLLPYAKSEKISIIAYSPLAQGLLTGKYTSYNRPTSFVQKINFRFSSRNLTRVAEVIRILSEIAQVHGKTSSQVALNWLIRKENVVAIPGVKRAQNVDGNAGATDWRLTDAEVKRLENAAANVRFDRLSGLPNLLRALTP